MPKHHQLSDDMKSALVAELVEKHHVTRAKAQRIVKCCGPYAVDVWQWVQHLLHEAHYSRGRKVRVRHLKLALWVAMTHLSELNESTLFFLLDRRHLLPRRLIVRGEVRIFVKGAAEVLRPLPARKVLHAA